MPERRKYRADRVNRDVSDALSALHDFTPATIDILFRRNQESNEIDGYASNTGYDRVGSGGTRAIRVDDEDVPLDSSTEAAALRRVEGQHERDPLGEAIDRVFELITEVAKLMREADRKRLVVIHAADGRRGRESSLQGNCICCSDDVSGVGDDRLRRGLDPKCWVSWTRWKITNATDDPGADFRRFTEWRREQMSVAEKEDWRIAEIDKLRERHELPPTGTEAPR